MLITIKQDSMKKSMAKQDRGFYKGPSNEELRKIDPGFSIGPSEEKLRRVDPGFSIDPISKDKSKDYLQFPKGMAYTKTVRPISKVNSKSPAPQLAPIDPRTGMPIQPQMTPQPNTVGMPGSMPMPDGMGHTLPEQGIQAGGRHMSPYTQKKKTSVAGQYITESGHMDVDIHKGPKEGDLIRGPHLKYDNVGLPKDFDYEVKFEKDTVDQHGPYKIYKTTGIK